MFTCLFYSISDIYALVIDTTQVKELFHCKYSHNFIIFKQVILCIVIQWSPCYKPPRGHRDHVIGHTGAIVIMSYGSWIPCYKSTQGPS